MDSYYWVSPDQRNRNECDFADEVNRCSDGTKELISMAMFIPVS